MPACNNLIDSNVTLAVPFVLLTALDQNAHYYFVLCDCFHLNTASKSLRVRTMIISGGPAQRFQFPRARSVSSRNRYCLEFVLVSRIHIFIAFGRECKRLLFSSSLVFYLQLVLFDAIVPVGMEYLRYGVGEEGKQLIFPEQ